jgi:GR25 family glycosyltransferase involved in LPS biosynthesis
MNLSENKTVKISYAILHVDTDVLREPLYLENVDYLNSFAVNLKQPSYGIYNKEDLERYYSLDLDLNINKNTNFRYSEIGCWASHYSAWKTFLESDNEYVLILEDDIKVIPGFKEILDLRMGLLPEGWDIFSVLVPEGNFSYFVSHIHSIGSDIISKTYQGNWLGAYVLNREGAKKLVDSVLLPIDRPVDIHIFYSPGMLNSYSLMPNSKMYLEGIDLGTTIHDVDRVFN